MASPLEMRAEQAGDLVRLLSPGVGLFTAAAPAGEVLTPGRHAGYLLSLGRASPLVVPAGVLGSVRTRHPERVHEPVGFGSVLYELSGLEGTCAELAGTPGSASGAGAGEGALLLRAPQTGRFWRRPSPAEPPLAADGEILQGGAPVGLIEVMKTFAPIVYRPGRGLPERARIVRALARDGADVREGDPLFELERA
jgi:biotin carboxyl carrier protein